MVEPLHPVVLIVGEVGGLGGVLLRPWRDDDRGVVLRACADPDIERWSMPPPESDRDFAQAWLTSRHRG